MTNLKKMRLRIGFTQKEVSEVAGVNLVQYREYEQGRRDINITKIKYLVKIAKKLKCKISDIIEDPKLIEECRELKI